MSIVVYLGWGSLIWRPEKLPIKGEWRSDGPILPIEFAHQSTKGKSAGALTLVLVPNYESKAQSLWVPVDGNSIEEAREALRKRESTNKPNIGVWKTGDTEPTLFKLADWARNHNISAVVWTALPPRFDGQSNRVPTVDEAVNYLRGLSGQERKNAEQYVRKAPLQIDTPYRRRFIKDLGLEFFGE